MKRHFRDAQGRLLQSDKSWKDLKLKQREWISAELRTRYLAACDAADGPSSKQECDAVVREVIGLIEARNIWVPDREVYAYFRGKKNRWFNKHARSQEAVDGSGLEAYGEE